MKSSTLFVSMNVRMAYGASAPLGGVKVCAMELEKRGSDTLLPLGLQSQHRSRNRRGVNLQREAERRRRADRLLMAVSFLTLMGLLGAFYEILTG